MGHHPADVSFGKAAHAKGWIDREGARDAMRTVKVLSEAGETTTLSRVLFEQDMLSAKQVRQLQDKLEQREALCECGSRVETYTRKPGSKARCPSCKAKVTVPGTDPKDPFHVPAAAANAPSQSGAQLALGVVGLVAVGAVLAQGAHESWGSHMGLGAVVTSSVAGALALVVTLRGSALGGAGILLATLSGLVVAAAAGNPVSEPAYSAFGLSAHAALPGLIALHLVLAWWVLKASVFPQGPEGVMAFVGLFSAPPLAFFVYRCLPGTDPTHYFTGPSVLAKVPWFAQPGAIALLYLFPLTACVLGGVALVRSLRKRSGGLLTHAGFAASLALLSGFGLAVGTVGDQLPTAGNPRLEPLLAARLDPQWKTHEPARASTAAAVQTTADASR